MRSILIFWNNIAATQVGRFFQISLLFLWLALFSGCATSQPAYPQRAFDFHADKLWFTNETVWEYSLSPDDEWVKTKKQPRPDYALHCFVMSQTARKFFYHASFDEKLPRKSACSYGELIKEVVERSSRKGSEEKIVIPGYRNLSEFSQAYPDIIKAKAGGAWRSYLQRGNWRMVLPFSRNHQAKTSAELQQKISHRLVPIVHLVAFPELTINHAVMLYQFEKQGTQVQFKVYDANNPSRPASLVYNGESKTFIFERNPYFPGGTVDVYEVYKNLWY